MYAVRSHAVATFLIGVGHQPIDVEYQGLAPVFLFPEAAHSAMSVYQDAKALLAMMADRKKPAAGQ
jgi:hypothetical protein